MRFVLLVAFVCLVWCPSVFAATITFEGFSNAQYTSPIVRSGFTIGNVTGDEQHFHEIIPAGSSFPNNGTGVLLNDRNTRIFVSLGGATFNLASVDVGPYSSTGTGLTISGYLLARLSKN